MTPSFLILLLALQIGLSYSAVIPDGFECSKDMPRRAGEYSNTAVKVDLIHIFCGQIYDDYQNNPKATGLHYLPPNTIPNSISLYGAKWKQKSGYKQYRNVGIYDQFSGTYIPKIVSSMWPSAMSMEQVVQTISDMVTFCR